MISVHFLTTHGQSLCPLISLALYCAARELMESDKERLDVRSSEFEFTIQTDRRYYSLGVFGGYRFRVHIQSDHQNPGELVFLCDLDPPERSHMPSSALN